jgi:hypothetical protein
MITASKTKTLGASIIVFTLLTACASTNPYNVPEGEGAYVRNRMVAQGRASFSYLFTAVGDEQFAPKVTTINARYKIPPGENVLSVQIQYGPSGGLTPFSSPYNIYVVKVDWDAPQDRWSSGLRGLTLNAVTGETYEIGCRIEDGKAYVWLETSAGEKVTEEVLGIGKYEGYDVSKWGQWWVWENLPPGR